MSDEKYNFRDNNIEIFNKLNEKGKYLCNDLIDDDAKGIIIDLLYKKLIEINQANKVAIGNCELIDEHYVKMDTELNMLSNAFNDIIQLKNKIFS